MAQNTTGTVIVEAPKAPVYGGICYRIAYTSSGEGDRMVIRKNLIAQILKQLSRQIIHALQHIDQADSTKK